MSKEPIYMLLYIVSIFVLTAISISIGRLVVSNNVISDVAIPVICIAIYHLFLIYHLLK